MCSSYIHLLLYICFYVLIPHPCYADLDFPPLFNDEYAPEDNRFIHVTIYTLIACLLMFLIAIVLLVAAICKLQKRTASKGSAHADLAIRIPPAQQYYQDFIVSTDVKRSMETNTPEKGTHPLERPRSALELGSTMRFPRFASSEPRSDTPNETERKIDDGRIVGNLDGSFGKHPVLPDGSVRPPPYADAVTYKLHEPLPENLTGVGLFKGTPDRVGNQAAGSYKITPCYIDSRKIEAVGKERGEISNRGSEKRNGKVVIENQVIDKGNLRDTNVYNGKNNVAHGNYNVFNGNDSVIYGDSNVINGDNNTLHGNNVVINGHNDNIHANNRVINGNNINNCYLENSMLHLAGAGDNAISKRSVGQENWEIGNINEEVDNVNGAVSIRHFRDSNVYNGTNDVAHGENNVFNGNNSVIYGDSNVINGDNNTLHGNNVVINGHDNNIHANNRVINGNNINDCDFNDKNLTSENVPLRVHDVNQNTDDNDVNGDKAVGNESLDIGNDDAGVGTEKDGVDVGDEIIAENIEDTNVYNGSNDIAYGIHNVFNGNDSYITGDNNVITGNKCQIYGTDNVINGDNNTLHGSNVVINGHNDNIHSSNRVINGDNMRD